MLHPVIPDETKKKVQCLSPTEFLVAASRVPSARMSLKRLASSYFSGQRG
jgi:hypothetical protein